VKRKPSSSLLLALQRRRGGALDPELLANAVVRLKIVDQSVPARWANAKKISSSRISGAMGDPAGGQQRFRAAMETSWRSISAHATCSSFVCLDETSKQLIAETRAPMPMRKGRKARIDYEYERNGTANLFMMFAPLEGWRNVKSRPHTAVDYACVLRSCRVSISQATTNRAGQDNLNTHTKASLYEASRCRSQRLAEQISNSTTRRNMEVGSIWRV